MMSIRDAVCVFTFGSAALPCPAVQRTEKVPESTIVQAFGQYERIGTKLSADSLNGIKLLASALAPVSKAIGGAATGTAASRLAAATTVKCARTLFDDLSEDLVRTFVAANIPGVHGFTS